MYLGIQIVFKDKSTPLSVEGEVPDSTVAVGVWGLSSAVVPMVVVNKGVAGLLYGTWGLVS